MFNFIQKIQNNRKLPGFPKVTVPFHTSPLQHESSSFQTSSPTLGVSSNGSSLFSAGLITSMCLCLATREYPLSLHVSWVLQHLGREAVRNRRLPLWAYLVTLLQTALEAGSPCAHPSSFCDLVQEGRGPK